jgi:hypothetical protein
MHAVFSDLVTRSRDHTTPSDPTHNEGLTDQSRVVVLLDGGVKRVHVDVKDRAGHSGTPDPVRRRRYHALKRAWASPQG